MKIFSWKFLLALRAFCDLNPGTVVEIFMMHNRACLFGFRCLISSCFLFVLAARSSGSATDTGAVRRPKEAAFFFR
jgi:hypothetical protein